MENQLIEMIQSLSSDDCRINARQQLDSWLELSLRLLRDTYNEKIQEIDQLFDTLTEDLEVYKQRQLRILTKQKDDLLLQEIEQLQQQLPNMIQIKSTPGSVYDFQICRSTNIIDPPTIYSTLRHSLLRTIPVQSYRFSSTCRAMASNSKRDEILLYDQDELILYHVNGTLGGSISWPTTENGFVSDIIWCSTLDCFLVLGRMILALFDTSSYTYTSVQEVRGNQSHHIIALTYIEQEKNVFVCCHDPKEILRQYDILPQWKLKKTWSKNDLINKDDVGIRCIRVNPSGTQLGLVIKNKTDQFRIGLYSMDLTCLFTTISIVPALSTIKNGQSIDFMLYLTPFIGDRWWLIVYGNGKHEHFLILFDSQTGTSEVIINDSILNACMLDEQYLIVRMKQSMLIYDIQ